MIDSHSHIYCDAFDDDRDDVVARAREAGVTRVVMPNESVASVEYLRAACERYGDYVAFTVGLHPEEVKTDYTEQLDILHAMLDDPTLPRVTAIGEIGIDLYWDRTYVTEQQDALERQLNWCVERDLPFIIHCRDGLDPIVEVLQSFRGRMPRGVFHSFTGTVADVEHLRTLGDFYFGVNGIVTFRKSEVKGLLPTVGLERLLLETDAPYLAPVPCRGRRNEPAYVAHVLRFVADYLNLDTTTVDEATTRNTLTLFKLWK